MTVEIGKTYLVLVLVLTAPRRSYRKIDRLEKSKDTRIAS